HDIVTTPRQLMRHCLDRHHSMGPGLLSLIKSSDERFKANRKIGCLYKRPRQILVPVLRIATAFAFAIGKFFTLHTAAVRCKVSHLGKSPDISGLQHDRKRQDLPNAADGEQIAIPRLEFDSLLNDSLQD